jgi:hypothetical protein
MWVCPKEPGVDYVTDYEDVENLADDDNSSYGSEYSEDFEECDDDTEFEEVEYDEEVEPE